MTDRDEASAEHHGRAEKGLSGRLEVVMVFWIVAEPDRGGTRARAAGGERYGPYPTRDEAQAALAVLGERYRRQRDRRLRLVVDPS